MRPTIAEGLRLALDPGHDERAVPVRSAALGAALGALGVVAVLVFSASMMHLEDTPRLYGWTWDMKTRDGLGPKHCDTTTFGIERIPGVGDIAAVCYQDFDINGHDTNVWGFTNVRGSIGPTIIEGRAPVSDDEVALGQTTLDVSHTHIGDKVHIVNDKVAHDYRIVGRTVFPHMAFEDVQPVADGAAMTGTGFAHLEPVPSDETTRYVLTKVDPAHRAAFTDQARTLAENRALGLNEADAVAAATEAVTGPTRPAEIDRLHHVQWFLPVLGAMLAVLALIAIAHALVTSVRRRRHELAILKAVGFARGQVRATVAWQATILAMVGLIIGIPVGVLVGRAAWSVVAGNLGVPIDVEIPAVAIALVVPVALALVNAIAFVPAWRAARTRTSVALATE